MRGDTEARLSLSPRPSMPRLSIHALRGQEQRLHLGGSKVPAQGGTLPCLFGDNAFISLPGMRVLEQGQQDRRRPLHLAARAARGRGLIPGDNRDGEKLLRIPSAQLRHLTLFYPDCNFGGTGGIFSVG